ncbi:MAG TPA: magnesium/cobalt transporter CorA [Planctomycetota bacterium]|nr:magnesium/cobalt transporter CorA [Planctomycetota bacterium]
MSRRRIKNLSRKKKRTAPGASPGTLALPEGAKRPTIHLFSYSGDFLEERDIASVADLQAPLKNTALTHWIEVRGLGDERMLRELAELFQIHPLTLEDVVHVPQRPKTEIFQEHQFIIARMVAMKSKEDIEAEQVSIFLGRKYVLTIREDGEDCLNPVRERLRRKGGIHRKAGADYLCYSIIDAIVDNYFPVLENYGEYLEQLEQETVAQPARQTLGFIHTAKRELLDLRRILWPQRDTVNQLIRDESPFISAQVRVYLRDCYDHAVQVMDMVETYREITSGLHDVYLSSIGNRTNEIMKVLTIISTIFIPLTFIAGVYGMNFDPETSPWNMPELKARYGYPVTMLVMFLIGMSLLYFFWNKGWIFAGAPPEPRHAELPHDKK